MFIPEEKISDIKNTADIVDIVSEFVLLKKTGKNYMGLCPFHSEKTPSFSVSPDKQIFYCFGCGAGGNVFSFLMKHESIAFPEAAKILARKYGIELPTPHMSSDQRKKMSERERLLTINKQAMEFYCHNLLHNALGQKASVYLEKRGLSKEIIDRFKLGYAPDGWDNLEKFFRKKNIPLSLAEKSGLIITKKNGGYYDRFRDRIIFPIFNIGGQAIGFGGRVMDDSLPKYLNSPETPLYNKSNSFYGLNMAKKACREKEAVYIVEGYMDLLALCQHNIENTVATLGTALAPRHVHKLRGYIGRAIRAILVYDSDEAGVKAAERSISAFNKEYVDAKILILPRGYDPDTFLFKFGAEAFLDKAGNALSIMSFLIESSIKRHGLSTEGKIKIIADLKEYMAAVDDNVAQLLYIQKLAERIGIDEAAVLEKIRTAGKKRTTDTRIRQSDNVSNDMQDMTAHGDRLEKRIISLMLQFPEILSEITKCNVLEYFEDEMLRDIGELVLKNTNNSDSQVSDLISLVNNKDQRRMIAALAIKEDVWNHEGCLNLIQQFISSRHRHQNSLLEKIKAAEQSNDHELLFQLLEKKQKQARKNAMNSQVIAGGKIL